MRGAGGDDHETWDVSSPSRNVAPKSVEDVYRREERKRVRRKELFYEILAVVVIVAAVWWALSL